jgi:hypothetical protein
MRMSDIPDSTPTQEEVLRRYPRLIAHMICESLGYFTPRAAANAIIYHKLGQPFYCEYYVHLAQRDGNVIEAARRQIDASYRTRRYHKGYMSDYSLAKQIIKQSLIGNDPIFASWF